MAKSMQQRYERARKKIREDEDITDSERELILKFLDANDPDKGRLEMPDGKTKAAGTLKNYARCLNRVARDMHPELSVVTAEQLNSLMDDYRSGRVESVKDEGLSNGSARRIQSALRRFYIYYDDFEVDHEDIIFADPEDPAIDERHLFSEDEVKALRKEAERRGSRDACLVDMLLYTGQRQSALLNLRVKDIRPEDGVFYLNDDDGDLKGASGKRPLLGAEKATRRWKRQHPTGKPVDYFITHKEPPGREGIEQGDRLDSATAYRALQRIGERAEVEKPVNPHNFRHYFVTVCKRNYGMDNDTIKHLIGHNSDSKVMERTYAHLTDDDYIQKAEVAQGIREPAEESPLTPPVCPTCDEPLSDTAKACESCGAVFTPDAKQAEDQIEDDIVESALKAKDEEVKEGIEVLREQLQENPELLKELIEEASS